MASSKIQAVIFDMGGVFVELGPISEIIGDEDLSVEEFWAGWLASPTVRAFERGQTSPEAFSNALVAELSLSMPPAEMLRRFANWPKGFFAGAEQMLLELQATGVSMAVLSNTNALHWEQQKDHEIISRIFACQYTSYSLGMVKPDAEIFDYVIADQGLRPDQILFVDDNQPNVDAARARGIDAERTCGPDEVRAVLQQRDLL